MTQHIKCTYHQQVVRGIIQREEPKFIVVKMLSAYQGKNESWEPGESKVLYRKLMKSIHITQHSKA